MQSIKDNKKNDSNEKYELSKEQKELIKEILIERQISTDIWTSTSDDSDKEERNESDDKNELPIITLADDESPIQRTMQEHLELIFDFISLPIKRKEINEKFTYKLLYRNTKCELKFDESTSLMCDSSNEELYFIFKHLEVYYRTEDNPELFPLICVCVVSKSTFELFNSIENIEEKASAITAFANLLPEQQNYIKHRLTGKANGFSNTDFVPITDQKALEMLFKVCGKFLPFAERAMANSIINDLSGFHSGNDKKYLLSKLSYILNIDTCFHMHKEKTYEEIIAILDKHIYGMNELKESIAEYFLAMQYSKKSYCNILLVGPPGVGKTSVCDAIAECFDVPISNIDCSGVDFLTLAGLVKSYSDAKTGKIMDAFLSKGTTDVLMRLEEIDKMAVEKDRANPYSAFVKPFDDRHQFYDEYLEFNLDVSNTKFISTCNDITQIPGYILNRFEGNIFHIKPYSTKEKLEIARKYIIPNAFFEYNIEKEKIEFTDEALITIIDKYCSDGGMRETKGYVKNIIRKVIKNWYKQGAFSNVLVVDAEYIYSNLRKCEQEKKRIGFI